MMPEHTILLEWQRSSPDFKYDSYSRNHMVNFGNVGKICGSASPEFHGDPQCLNPEQAFVMSVSSCHLLTFLAIASRKGYVVDSYIDKAIGTLGKNSVGKIALTKVELQPNVVFSGDRIPSNEEYQKLHTDAHNGCIISNSIAGCVIVTVNARIEVKL